MNTYIIDFDSTFTQVEALDELARLALKDSPKLKEVVEEIDRLTKLAMEGELSFRDSLEQRIHLLGARREHLDQLVRHLHKKVSKSFSRNRIFFREHAPEVLIVSGGFREFIEPVVRPFGIRPENIYANTFAFASDGQIIGFDRSNPLSEEGGKVKLLKQLDLQGKVYAIGDGYSDFQLKESGMIDRFFAFTENIEREMVIDQADHVAPTFDEFLFVNRLPRAISYPRHRILCLLIGTLEESSAALLAQQGFSIRRKESLEEKYLPDVAMIFFASDVTADTDLLRKCPRLKTMALSGRRSSRQLNEWGREQGVVIFDSLPGKKTDATLARRMADFMNRGDTEKSANFPGLRLPAQQQAHRLIHIHQNVPGVMAALNQVLAKHGANILAQFLMTRDSLGYAITDIDRNYSKDLLREMRRVEHTIKFRVLY